MPAAEVLVLVPEHSTRAPVDARSDVWGRSDASGGHVRGEAAFFVAEVGVIRLDLDLDLHTDTVALELQRGDGEALFSMVRSLDGAGVALSSYLCLGGISPGCFPDIIDAAIRAIHLLINAVSLADEDQRGHLVAAEVRLRRAVIRSAAGNLLAIDDDAWGDDEDELDVDLRRPAGVRRPRLVDAATTPRRSVRGWARHGLG